MLQSHNARHTARAASYRPSIPGRALGYLAYGLAVGFAIAVVLGLFN